MPEFSDAETRPLPFSLLDSEVIETETPEVIPSGVFVWPEDPDEQTIVLFSLSQHEYTALASAIDVGRDIAFGEDSTKLWWLWIRNMIAVPEICAMIIDCIENDEDTQAAFADYLANNPLARQAIQSLIDNGSLLIGEGGATVQNDDLAALFGAVTYIVDTMNEAIQDLYQAYESTTNTRERGELIFSAIPVIETLPVDEISEYVTMLEENVVEGYLSQWDTTPITGTRDRIRCALFCAAKDNGNTLTWSMIEDYFWGRVGFTVSNISNIIGEFVVFLGTGSWEGEEIVDISFGNFAAAMRGGQKFGEMIFPSLSKLMLLGQNDPDEDYEIVCEDCIDPPPADCWDFTGSQDGWEWLNEPEGSFGNWAAGGFTRGTSNDLIIQLEITEPVVEITVTFSEPVSNIQIRALAAYSFAALADNSATSQSVHVIEITGDGSHGMGIWCDNMPSGAMLIGVCVEIAP